jgi:hypothetical protein
MTGVEAAFALAVLDPARPVPTGVTTARGEPDRLRLAVYRNTVHVSLVEALARGFPVCRMVVGDEFFKAMARAYVGQCKPATPVLLHYGTGFPDFIARFPPAAGLPYLSDLARLERARTTAYHAADVAVLERGALAALSPDAIARIGFIAHPAARLVGSTFAIGSIWLAHQSNPTSQIAVNNGEAVLVTRPAAEVISTIVPRHDVPFIQALLDGETLADASNAAHGPDFDPGRALLGLISLGALTSLHHHEWTDRT